MRLLSLFSGCGGMDIGFEGDFTCLKDIWDLMYNGSSDGKASN